MLLKFLCQITDHRRRQGRRYQLGPILFSTVLAILSGATSYRKVQAFIRAHYTTLNQWCQLNWKRLPAQTTIRAMIQGTSSEELEATFRAYSEDWAQHETAGRGVAFDGKVLRGSFDHFQDQKAIQQLSAFLTDNHLILAHVEIAEKTNEIPTAQALIDDLGLSGCLLTFDALHCQEKTLRVAQDTGNEAIVQVKENQPTLFRDCQTTAETQPPTSVYQEPAAKAHNRIERRHVAVFTPPTFSDPAKWQRVEAVVKVDRHRQSFDTQTKSWKPSHETSFYISTTVLDAVAFGSAIRQHWGIENRDHYVRDVTLGEDRSRIRTNPHLFAKLRSFALNILRANKVENVSLELFNNCMNLNNILNYVGVR